MNEILVRCFSEKRDPTYPLDGYHFYENQIYEASHHRNLWFVHDHKHNLLIIEEGKFPEHFKEISDNLISYKLWSSHHFYSQTKRVVDKVEIKCPCSPMFIQKIALGKSNPIKFHHSLIVHLSWSCEFCGKRIPFEVDLDRKTIKAFELMKEA